MKILKIEIYAVTNLVSGKIYIGQTVHTLKQRKLEHIQDARNKGITY